VTFVSGEIFLLAFGDKPPCCWTETRHPLKLNTRRDSEWCVSGLWYWRLSGAFS